MKVAGEVYTPEELVSSCGSIDEIESVVKAVKQLADGGPPYIVSSYLFNGADVPLTSVTTCFTVEFGSKRMPVMLTISDVGTILTSVNKQFREGWADHMHRLRHTAMMALPVWMLADTPQLKSYVSILEPANVAVQFVVPKLIDSYRHARPVIDWISSGDTGSDLDIAVCLWCLAALAFKAPELKDSASLLDLKTATANYYNFVADCAAKVQSGAAIRFSSFSGYQGPKLLAVRDVTSVRHLASIVLGSTALVRTTVYARPSEIIVDLEDGSKKLRLLYQYTVSTDSISLPIELEPDSPTGTELANSSYFVVKA